MAGRVPHRGGRVLEAPWLVGADNMTLRGSIAVPVSLVQRLPRLVTGTSNFGGGDGAACCGCTMPHRPPAPPPGRARACQCLEASQRQGCALLPPIESLDAQHIHLLIMKEALDVDHFRRSESSQVPRRHGQLRRQHTCRRWSLSRCAGESLRSAGDGEGGLTKCWGLRWRTLDPLASARGLWNDITRWCLEFAGVGGW